MQLAPGQNIDSFPQKGEGKQVTKNLSMDSSACQQADGPGEVGDKSTWGSYVLRCVTDLS